MKSWARHPLLVTGRLVWLGGELVLAAINYAIHCAFQPRAALPMARAKWLQQASRRALKLLRVETHVSGGVPRTGLLACNHLGYLDALVLAAIAPSQFVAKSEVQHWPVFGWFARLAGTIFVNRNKPSRAAESAGEISASLREGALVVLFPEGTSSGGETVLPFKSSLLEPAARNVHPLTAGWIDYRLPGGDASEEVCYWKDMTLLPHLINLLSKGGVRASVIFTELQPGSSNRKELARRLHSAVLNLKTSLAP